MRVPPYWASSRAAWGSHVPSSARLRLAGAELGAGLGLRRLPPRSAAHVLATDWAADAVELLRQNAARNRAGSAPRSLGQPGPLPDALGSSRRGPAL